MKVLVTGGGGFLGLAICKQLINDGHIVTSLSRSHYISLDPLNISTIKCDISSIEATSKLDLKSFDAVIHTAAKAGVWGDRKEYFKTNYDGTVNLVNISKRDGIKYFIYTSSPSVVFGDDHIINGDETLSYPDKFYTDYAESKAKAEDYVLKNNDSDFRTISIRPHLIWGPGDPHLIPRILEKARKGRLKLVGNADNQVDIIYVDNAAFAHTQALLKLDLNPGLGGNSYFIGQEKPVNLWSFIGQILSINNIAPLEKKVSFTMAFFIGHVFEVIFKLFGILRPEPPMTRFVALQLAKSHFFNQSKAINELGYKPLISIEDGLQKTFRK